MSSDIKWVIKETWLSRKPDSLAAFIAAVSTFSLALVSLIYWRDFFHAQNWMSASGKAVFENHEYWRAWTSLFIHADEKHLFSNSFLFFILGTFITGYFSYWLFPFFGILVGGFINLYVLSKMPLDVHLIGASGVVYWMGGTWLSLYFLLDTKRSSYQRTLRSLGVALLLFVPAEAFDPSISYLSHSVGFFVGIVSGLIYYAFQRKTFLAAEVREIVVEDPEEVPATEVL